MNKIKLSICVLSIFSRADHLQNLLRLLYSQPKELLNQCEILLNIDDRTRTIGEKRNELLQSVKGDYVTFIDDDDDITPEYLQEVFIGINQGVDAIGITGIYAPITALHKPFKCSKDYKWEERPDAYYRSIQHICPIRTEIAKSVQYPEINFGEDKGYSDRINSLVKSDYVSIIPIYIYKYIDKKW